MSSRQHTYGTAPVRRTRTTCGLKGVCQSSVPTPRFSFHSNTFVTTSWWAVSHSLRMFAVSSLTRIMKTSLFCQSQGCNLAIWILQLRARTLDEPVAPYQRPPFTGQPYCTHPYLKSHICPACVSRAHPKQMPLPVPVYIYYLPALSVLVASLHT